MTLFVHPVLKKGYGGRYLNNYEIRGRTRVCEVTGLCPWVKSSVHYSKEKTINEEIQGVVGLRCLTSFTPFRWFLGQNHGRPTVVNPKNLSIGIFNTVYETWWLVTDHIKEDIDTHFLSHWQKW